MKLKSSKFIFITILLILNLGYISIEIYKSILSKPLGPTITQSEFSRISTLSDFAYLFEVAFILVSLTWILLMFIKRNRTHFIQHAGIHASLLISLFVINYILSWSFNAPVGNLTQLLYGPFVFVIGAMIYFVLTELLFKKIRYKKV
ncbi:hypothetical protein FPQ10_08530 [Allobacillus sp. SKP2-8]|uniref:hypothetical protein n=1 Tax=unclassified Allobacillus TaxID=2628859 RepID=UPI001182790E|nr:hypothetical protein [Allobacillus sp. SKP2-8]TSJ65929.1 hypothetical protein FPQ10_08530 [Allobacillus sp. SKP2-8]